jgi:hypothetical protein
VIIARFILAIEAASWRAEITFTLDAGNYGGFMFSQNLHNPTEIST